VIFTDALSVVTALKSQRPTDLGDLIDLLDGLAKSYQKVVIEWVPTTTSKLAKEGGALQQEDTGLTYEVAKSYIKCHLSSKWEKDHPSHQKGDAFHQLPRHAQATILRLRKGNNRLRHHMYHKFKVGDSDMCTCGTTPMTVQVTIARERKHGSRQLPSRTNCTEMRRTSI
jgi:hypothetical protein